MSADYTNVPCYLRDRAQLDPVVNRQKLLTLCISMPEDLFGAASACEPGRGVGWGIDRDLAMRVVAELVWLKPFRKYGQSDALQVTHHFEFGKMRPREDVVTKEFGVGQLDHAEFLRRTTGSPELVGALFAELIRDWVQMPTYIKVNKISSWR